MKAAIIEKPGDIRVRTVDDPTPGRGEIVVKVGACGICGTDLHIADGEFPPTPYPIVPGHELAGELVALGPDVAGLAEGQRVAVDPSLYCGHCRFCRVGKGNLCENWDAIGDTVSGGFAEYVAVPAANAYAVPDTVSYRHGALIEPLSCAVHGMHVLSPRMGDSFLVVGAGTMGLMLLQLALRGNASRVAVADLSEERLARARRLGATSTTTDMTSLRDDEDLGFDCVIDATGVPQVIEASFDMVKRGGKLLVFGVAPAEARGALAVQDLQRRDHGSRLHGHPQQLRPGRGPHNQRRIRRRRPPDRDDASRRVPRCPRHGTPWRGTQDPSPTKRTRARLNDASNQDGFGPRSSAAIDRQKREVVLSTEDSNPTGRRRNLGKSYSASLGK
jgi:2-desacetyl-2-hydroxyethyl bacteriochlorophyllide A dehydrogenase